MRLWSPTGVNLYKKLFNMSDEKLTEHIIDTSFNTYGQAAKELQVSTVMNLARGRSTFLLAGTGFGKSRISEMYYDLIPKKSKGVVLVLNPLDTLGNNQVLEKVQAGFTAINLTKLTFNTQAATGILRGDYNFVY
jgi:superfamily II DNA helicase RecQ